MNIYTIVIMEKYKEIIENMNILECEIILDTQNIFNLKDTYKF